MVDPVSNSAPATTNPATSPQSSVSPDLVKKFNDSLVAASLNFPKPPGGDPDDGDTPLELPIRAPVIPMKKPA